MLGISGAPSELITATTTVEEEDPGAARPGAGRRSYAARCCCSSRSGRPASRRPGRARRAPSSRRSSTRLAQSAPGLDAGPSSSARPWGVIATRTTRPSSTERPRIDQAPALELVDELGDGRLGQRLGGGELGDSPRAVAEGGEHARLGARKLAGAGAQQQTRQPGGAGQEGRRDVVDRVGARGRSGTHLGQTISRRNGLAPGVRATLERRRRNYPPATTESDRKRAEVYLVRHGPGALDGEVALALAKALRPCPGERHGHDGLVAAERALLELLPRPGDVLADEHRRA